MTSYVEVAVNVPQVQGTFHYHLPAELEGKVQAGHLVVVPFGKQRVQGVVLRPVSVPAVSQTQAVRSLVDPQPVLNVAQLQLAQFLSERTLSPLAACLDLMIPPGLSKQAELVYTPEPDEGARESGLTEFQARLLELLLQRGPLRTRQLDRTFSRLDWRRSMQVLVRRGLVSTHSMLLPPSVQPKTARSVQLILPLEEAEARLAEVGRMTAAIAGRRGAVLRFLAREEGPTDAAWVFAETGANLNDLQQLAAKGLVLLGTSEVWRDPLEGLELKWSPVPTLSAEQAAVWDEILSEVRAAAAGQAVLPILLHGVTGAGKTEIYLRAIEETLKLGRQALLLVPEIALTPQTVRRVAGRFPGQVGVLHSRLSDGERYDTWRRARDGQLGVVVGPRSALFAPLPHIGLIVVDEFHDDSYYQSDHPPMYHAREAALAYARRLGALCLLGSATPDVVSYHQVRQGKGRYLRLGSRIAAQVEESQPAQPHPLPQQIDLPEVMPVDMRQELRSGNRSIFSRSLREALSWVLKRQEQAILFLNRRGAATYVFCRDCGLVLKCPRCEIPLTYHHPVAGETSPVDFGLLCHYCGYRRNLPSACPECHSGHIRHYGTGTEKVEAEVLALFPEARTLRLDTSTTQKKGAHETLLTQFASHESDILIGTQMLAKGLDLPLVTLVGVVLADVGLGLPDYRAAERTFTLLEQVAGRAGRSPLGGRVILQTFQPEHYAIQAAVAHDYQGFYLQELTYRRRMGYPPFTQFVRMEFRNRDEERAEQEAQAMADKLRHWIQSEGRRSTTLIGPAPCFFARLDGQYRWQIVLRGPDPVSLLRGRSFADWRVEVNPPSLL